MEQSLISPKVLKIVAVFLESDQPLYVREIARKLDLSPATVSRILKGLISQELVISQTRGSLKLFQLNPNHPSLPEITGLAQKEAGRIPLITRVLKQIPLVHSATVYGSAAKNQLTSTSDIDLMIVGTPPVDDLNQKLNRLEKTLGREINYSLYSPDEFSQQKSRPGFLKYILNQPHQTIIGTL